MKDTEYVVGHFALGRSDQRAVRPDSLSDSRGWTAATTRRLAALCC